MTGLGPLPSWSAANMPAVLLLLFLFLDSTFGFEPVQSEADQHLMKWAFETPGFKSKVTIHTTSEGMRGLFAAERIQKGDVIIDVPETMYLSVKNAGAAEAAPLLLKELQTPCSRVKPYLDALPKFGSVLTGYNLPEEYIKHLAARPMEEQILLSFQRHVRDVLSGKHNYDMEMIIPEAVGNMTVSVEHYAYVVSLLTSRTFSVRRGALTLVPVADCANHDVREFNKLDTTERPGFRIIAGRDFEPGEHVTITYGPMRNDELLLYYGFLDEVTMPPLLPCIDHPKFVQYKTDSYSLGREAFTGTAEEIAVEVVRLQAILTQLHNTIAVLGPIPCTNPAVARLVARFRELRIMALQHEIARLKQAEPLLPPPLPPSAPPMASEL